MPWEQIVGKGQKPTQSPACLLCSQERCLCDAAMLLGKRGAGEALPIERPPVAPSPQVRSAPRPPPPPPGRAANIGAVGDFCAVCHRWSWAWRGKDCVWNGRLCVGRADGGGDPRGRLCQRRSADCFFVEHRFFCERGAGCSLCLRMSAPSSAAPACAFSPITSSPGPSLLPLSRSTESRGDLSLAVLGSRGNENNEGGQQQNRGAGGSRGPQVTGPRPRQTLCCAT